VDSDIRELERRLTGDVSLVHRYCAYLERCGAFDFGKKPETSFVIEFGMEKPHSLSLFINGRNNTTPRGVGAAARLETTLAETRYRITRNYRFSTKCGWRARDTRQQCLTYPSYPLTASGLRHYTDLINEYALEWLKENGAAIQECNVLWNTVEITRERKRYLAALANVQRVEKDLYDAVVRMQRVRDADYKLEPKPLLAKPELMETD
jgi:hypothetical protein